METQIEIGKNAHGDPIMVSVIQCDGFKDIDTMHIKVHVDPIKGKKRNRRKNNPKQTEMDLK